MPEMRWLIQRNPKAACLLYFIMEHMHSNNTLALSYQYLEEYFGWSKRSLIRYISLLKENGFIHSLKMGTANMYMVNDEIAWTSYANQKQFAKYEGNILISVKENADYFHKKNFDKTKIMKLKAE